MFSGLGRYTQLVKQYELAMSRKISPRELAHSEYRQQYYISIIKPAKRVESNDSNN